LRSIIPNSIVNLKASLSKDWTLTCQLSPSVTLKGVLLVLIVTLFLLGLVIFMLDRSEHLEDELERKKLSL
jgi:hypothetical protein